jgi:hypothetical protein
MLSGENKKNQEAIKRGAAEDNPFMVSPFGGIDATW